MSLMTGQAATGE